MAQAHPDKTGVLKPQQVVTLQSTSGYMPRQGNKLIANGYKLQSTTVDGFGTHTWVFVADNDKSK